MHIYIISLSLTHPLFIEVSVASKESDLLYMYMYICMVILSILPHSTILISDIGDVWYFVFFILYIFVTLVLVGNITEILLA